MRSSIIFVWDNYGPYHIDRLEAAARAFKDTHRVVGIEIAESSRVYPWVRIEDDFDFEHVTLFAHRQIESISTLRSFIELVRACLRVRPEYVFLCHYERIEIHLLAWVLRLFRVRIFAMIDLKFDDKPRYAVREFLKKIFFLPYHGALVGGERSRSYLQFLGFDPANIYFGYDTVSMMRIRRLSGSPSAPNGNAFNDRHFTIVARLVPKKNIATALVAYSEYCKLAGRAARELHICGSGELEVELRRTANYLGLTRVIFHGFVQSAEVSRLLSSTLALILSSVEEQWGLVINEALAMGVPILCSRNAGASDRLVRTAINGYIFEPDNPKGLAQLLYMLSLNEDEWRRLAEGASRLAPLADTQQFVAGVREAITRKAKFISVSPRLLREISLDLFTKVSPPLFQRVSEVLFDLPIPKHIRRRNVLFIHIPKNAGTSVAMQLYGTPLAHRKALFYLRSDANWFATRRSFAIVRNPWDRVVSAYEFARQNGSELVTVDPMLLETIKRFNTFGEFILDYLYRKKGHLSTLDPVFRSQKCFVCDEYGSIIVDKIFKFEKLSELGMWLVEQGVQFLPNVHINRTPKRQEYGHYYGSDDRLIDAVYELYEDDIKKFDYIF